MPPTGTCERSQAKVNRESGGGGGGGGGALPRRRRTKSMERPSEAKLK